jgi:hypothetical protein
MINAAFVGQAQGYIRRKLQKLEGFTGMNASQILEVATKVFVSQDQEARWETNRKMKRKMDLLEATLARQTDEPLIQEGAEAIPKGGNKCFQDAPP